MKQNTLKRKMLVVLLAFAMIAIGLGINNWTVEESFADSASGGKVINDQDTANGVPTSLEGSELKWATQVGSGYSNATTSPLLLNGKLYVVGGGKLKEIDKTTGEVLGISEESVSNLYNYFLSTDGTNIVLMCGTKVLSFNQDLEHNWTSETFTGAQGLCNLYYDSGNGYLYGGTATGLSQNEAKPATFFCINAYNGETVWTKAATVGGSEQYTGSYWANPTVVGDYVLFGEGSGRVISFDKANGDEVSSAGKSTDGSEAIRSGIVYSNGNVYYTNKAGYICKIGFNSATGELGIVTSAKIDEAATDSISTPVIYNNRIYVCATTNTGTKGVVGVINAETLENIYSVPITSKGQDVTLVVDNANNRVIGFSTYYGIPGGVVGFTDTAGQTTAKYVDFGMQIADISTQYCASQVVVDEDGTIYATNDSGKIYAIGKNEAYLTSLSTGTGTLDKAFTSIDNQYEIVVPKDTESVELTFGTLGSSTVSIDDQANTTGKYTATLADGTAKALIKVTSGSDSRTYTVNIRESKSDVGTYVASTTANSITSGYEAISAESGETVYVIHSANGTTTSNYKRVWLGTSDTNAKISDITIVSGQAAAAAEKTSVNGDKTYTYWINSNVSKTTYPAVLKYTVTAENSTDAKDYYIVLTDKEDNSGFSIPTGIDLDNDELVVGGTYETTRKLNATTTEVGTASKETVNWTSSDASIATVDQNGNVTAVSAGKATITASYGDYIATCEVTSKVATEDAVVYVTISDKGTIQIDKDGANMTQAPVTVKDLNADGILSMDEALYAAHNEYYDGGALAGYTASSSAYGTTLIKLWGNNSGNFGYWINNVSCMSLDDEVKAGDYVNAFITVAWPETALYTAFDKDAVVVKPGEKAVITLQQYVWDDSRLDLGPWGGYAVTPFAGGKAKLVQTKTRGADDVYTADENGQITVNFDEEGTYYLQTYAENESITPNVCKIVVSKTADQITGDVQSPSGNGGNTEKDIIKNIKTGDTDDLQGWLAVILIAVLAASLAIAGKRRKEE